MRTMNLVVLSAALLLSPLNGITVRERLEVESRLEDENMLDASSEAGRTATVFEGRWGSWKSWAVAAKDYFFCGGSL